MQNLLARRIAIWYENANWVHDIYNEIINDIPKDAIIAITGSIIHNNLSIQLVDGSFIRFTKISDSARGCCFTESYIQSTIDLEKINTIIRPCTKIGLMECRIIDNYEDLWRPHRITEKYNNG